jgi:hypothetical protein
VTRRPSLFQRRIVITIPPWGVVVVAAAIAGAILDRFAMVTEIISVILCFISLVAVLTAQRIVKNLRYQVHAIITNQDNEDLNEEIEEPETSEPTPIFRTRRSG